MGVFAGAERHEFRGVGLAIDFENVEPARTAVPAIGFWNTAMILRSAPPAAAEGRQNVMVVWRGAREALVRPQIMMLRRVRVTGEGYGIGKFREHSEKLLPVGGCVGRALGALEADERNVHGNDDQLILGNMS